MKTFLILLSLSALASPAAAQQPRAEMAESTWDFGIVEQGEKRTKRVPIRNSGDRVLRLYRVKITCGCLTGWTEKKELEPGEECNVVIQIATERRVGRIAKSVFVETNDLRARRIEVKVVGEIRAAWWPSVSHVSLGRVERGSDQERVFDLEVRPGTPMELLRTTSSVSWVKTETEPFGEVDGAHGWRVRIRLAKNAPVGRLTASILFETDFRDFNRQNVAVTGEVVGPITVAPARVQFGRLGAGESKEVVVTITRASGKGLEIRKINCLDAEVKTEVVEKTAGAVYELHVSITPAGDRRRLAGRLYVHTNLPFRRVITIAYTGSLAP